MRWELGHGYIVKSFKRRHGRVDFNNNLEILSAKHKKQVGTILLYQPFESTPEMLQLMPQE
jgi:hypothetical protein